MKLIKSRDGTFKCECRVDFVITHNGDVECASCGQVAGRLTDNPSLRISQDTTDLSDHQINEQIQFNNNILHYLESSLEATMISDSDRKTIKDLKSNIRKLKRLQYTKR